MGGEFAQFIEWRFYEELEWKLLDYEMHRKFQGYVKELNHFYRQEKALWECDFLEKGFSWIEADNSGQSVLVFQRRAEDPSNNLVVVCNFAPVYHEKFRIGVPQPGFYQEVFNSDLPTYGGFGQINSKPLRAGKKKWQNQEYSLEMKMPSLAVVFLKLTKHTVGKSAHKNIEK